MLSDSCLTSTRRILSNPLLSWVLLQCGVLVCACGSPGPSEEAPAHIDNPTTEEELTTIRLSARAEERIGIELGVVESRSLQQRRSLGGEVIAPPGSAVTVTAPGAATVLAPASGPPPTAGARVTQGQALLRLVVLPGGGDLGRVQEELTVAEARLANAEAKANRAQALLREGVGTQAEYEDATAELESARAVHMAARARLDLLQTGRTNLDLEDLSPITLQAPESGVVHSVHFAVGQTVSDGALLMEIVTPDPLWVRVPVYVGDVATIDRSAPASVVGPGDPPNAPGRPAIPIQGPPTADPSAVSADLFYRLDNPDGRFRPGARVGISVAYGQADEELVVPWSAILHDIHGGTWIYEALGEHAYARRRVEVEDVVEGFAILHRGPAPGTSVVIVGAMELYSTEFGTTH